MILLYYSYEPQNNIRVSQNPLKINSCVFIMRLLTSHMSHFSPVTPGLQGHFPSMEHWRSSEPNGGK